MPLNEDGCIGYGAGRRAQYKSRCAGSAKTALAIVRGFMGPPRGGLMGHPPEVGGASAQGRRRIQG